MEVPRREVRLTKIFEQHLLFVIRNMLVNMATAVADTGTLKRIFRFCMNRYRKKVNSFSTPKYDKQNFKKSSKLVKNCSQETLSKISNRIFSSVWSGNPDFFLPMAIYIKKSVFKDLVCIPRWPTAFKSCRIRFRNFQRFSFMCMYRWPLKREYGVGIIKL